MSAKTFEQFSEEALKDGYDEVVVREWPPNHQTPAHEHPFDAHVLVVRGELTLTLGDQPRQIKAGDIFDVARGTTHIEHYGPDGATFWTAKMNA